MLLKLPTPRLPLACCVATAFGLLAAPALADDSRDYSRWGDRIEARLKSYQEVPAVSSVASGRFKAHVDNASQTLSYELSYSGLEGTVTQSHIHFGQRGVNGGITIWLCQTATNPSPVPTTPQCPLSPSATVTGTLTSANVTPNPGAVAQGIAAMELAKVLAAIRAGAAYVNVHSSKFPGGEIRGQLRDDD